MASNAVHVVDYGLGNLFSIARALEHVGASVKMVTAGEELESAERVVLPGVGSFKRGMQNLRASRFDEGLKHVARRGVPILGICLGMQLLAEAGEEHGLANGLGLIGGRVTEIPKPSDPQKSFKLPHIGWARLQKSSLASPKGTLLDFTDENDAFYFVHSYSFCPSEARDALAWIEYETNTLCAVVQRGNVMGTQFHPEKSGPSGLNLIRRFLELN